MEAELKKKVDYYVNLPYTITIERRDDQGTYYVARFIELPHFLMTGKTPEEAAHELESEKREWFEDNIEAGNKIPLPLRSLKYSGKTSLRMPSHLHENLIILSELEGTSLNNFIVKALTRTVEHNETAPPPKKPGRKRKATA